MIMGIDHWTFGNDSGAAPEPEGPSGPHDRWIPTIRVAAHRIPVPRVYRILLFFWLVIDK